MDRILRKRGRRSYTIWLGRDRQCLQLVSFRPMFAKTQQNVCKLSPSLALVSRPAPSVYLSGSSFRAVCCAAHLPICVLSHPSTSWNVRFIFLFGQCPRRSFVEACPPGLPAGRLPCVLQRVPRAHSNSATTTCGHRSPDRSVPPATTPAPSHTAATAIASQAVACSANTAGRYPACRPRQSRPSRDLQARVR